jgi:LPXTG-motif cell wall-anchored protein
VAPAELPDFARKLTAAEVVKLDVDASDNTDGFAVLVAGPAGGTGGGGEDPSLPLTGPVAASVAGAGAVALALGTFLFVSARRRRIVLVTPADGK